MATSRQQKEADLQELTEDLKQARGVVFAQYRGLKVKDIDRIRKSMRKDNVKYKVVKMTLLRKALESMGVNLAGLKYSGPIALAMSSEEETIPARLVKDLGKEFQSLTIDGGIFNQEVVDAAVVVRLASLPSKQQLLGQLVSVIAGPARGLVTVLSGNMRQLVYALNAIAESKQ